MAKEIWLYALILFGSVYRFGPDRPREDKSSVFLRYQMRHQLLYLESSIVTLSYYSSREYGLGQ